MVADTGRGIAPVDLPNIFERFYRVKGTGQEGQPSTGLGLAISKWIVEEHGGVICVQSSLGHGSIFTVRLPVLANKESSQEANR